jgi:hypothetical protein
VAWQFPAARRRAAGHRVAAAATAELLGLEAPAGQPGLPVAAELVPDELVPDEARAALASLRAQVTLALERADLAAELARRASVDPLTGLANRAGFSQRLREALAGLDGPPDPPRPGPGPAPAGPGRLQDDQRQPRPLLGRRGAAGGGRAPAGLPAAG